MADDEVKAVTPAQPAGMQFTVGVEKPDRAEHARRSFGVVKLARPAPAPRLVGTMRLARPSRWRRLFGLAKFLFFTALLGSLLIFTSRTKLSKFDPWMGEDSLVAQWAPSFAAWVSRGHVNLEVFYSRCPVFAAGIDSGMYLLWVFAISFWGPVRNGSRANWLRAIGVIGWTSAILISLIVGAKIGVDRGWKCFDTLLIVAGGAVFVVLLLMTLHEWRESRSDRPPKPSPGRPRDPQRARFRLVWGDMVSIGLFIAVLKDSLLLIFAALLAASLPNILSQAIRAGDVEAVRKIVEKDPSILKWKYHEFDKEWRPAHLAIVHGRQDVLSLLLQMGADASAGDRAGQTPLVWCAQVDYSSEMAESLLEHGADLNKADVNGDTPLIHAVQHGNIPVVAVLIRYKAKLDLRNDEGRTALHYAAATNQLDVARLLIERGAATEITDNTDLTPLELARSLQEGVVKQKVTRDFDQLANLLPPAVGTCSCSLHKMPIDELLLRGRKIVEAEHGPVDYSEMLRILHGVEK